MPRKVPDTYIYVLVNQFIYINPNSQYHTYRGKKIWKRKIPRMLCDM